MWTIANAESLPLISPYVPRTSRQTLSQMIILSIYSSFLNIIYCLLRDLYHLSFFLQGGCLVLNSRPPRMVIHFPWYLSRIFEVYMWTNMFAFLFVICFCYRGSQTRTQKNRKCFFPPLQDHQGQDFVFSLSPAPSIICLEHIMCSQRKWMRRTAISTARVSLCPFAALFSS